MTEHDPVPEKPRAAGTPERPRRVFVSYSRREFYFAEAMTAALRSRAGLDPWFDVERLRPGTDWAAALDAGLEDADCLLLLASPSSLASEFVRHEWTRALERGIHVHVAVVEAVELPHELSACPVHDLRTRFLTRALTLGGQIERGATGATAPPPRRRGLPARLPAPIAAVVALSLLTSVFLVWLVAALVVLDTALVRLAWNPFDDAVHWSARGSALDVMRGNQWTMLMFVLVGVTALALSLTPYVLVPGVGVLRRGSSRVVLVLGLLASTAVGTLLLTGVVLYLEYGAMGDPALSELIHPVPAPVTEAAEALRAPAAGVIACSAVGAAVAGSSRTLHLWSPTGTSPDFYRAQVTRRRPTHRQVSTVWKDLRGMWAVDSSLPSTAAPSRLDRSFVVRWTHLLGGAAPPPHAEGDAAATFAVVRTAPADAVVADHLAWAFRQAGTYAGPDEARWVLVLVSSQASWEETTREVGRFGPRAVCVLVDTMALPPDAGPLRRQQWLDFRERRADTLLQLVTDLRSSGAVRTDRGLPTTPVITHRFRAPTMVRYCVRLCVDVPAFFPGFSLVAVVLRPLEVQSTLLLAVAVLVTVLFARLGIRVARRRASSARFLGSAGLLSALMLLWSAVAASVLWIPADRSPAVPEGWEHAPVERILALSGPSGVVSFVIPALVPSLCLALALAAFYVLVKEPWLLPGPGTADPSRLLPRRGFPVGFWPVFAAYGILVSLMVEYAVAYM
ncbi:toll/interleukin-1 receptor domain-containing protein [Nocardiopsis sp. NPDC006198]|uniref:toll/interleukin-1 receptor domain-containing protein n=1 Tax=Nocardiopsis sp. NPDC006198 TaxID=3154472 RepID=UPI0033AEF6F4